MLEFLVKHIYINRKIIKYIISGGTAALIDILLLFLFTEVFGLWYLISAFLAFLIAFFVSFYLQKYWTFRDKNKKKIYSQMFKYFFVGGVNIIINTGGVYLLVDKFDIYYIIAQIIMGAIIGTSSFIIYGLMIFKKRKEQKRKKRANMHILIATGIFPPDIGGPATYAKKLFKELEKFNCDVRVVTYGEKALLGGHNSRICVVDRNQNILFRYFKYFWRIYRMLEWTDIFYTLDLVSAGLPAALVAKIKHKKVVFRTGGDFLWEKAMQKGWTNLPLKDYYKERKNINEKILINFSRWILKKMDLILFSTELQKNIYKNFYNITDQKIKIVPNAIPEIRYEEGNNLYKEAIVFAGRLVNLKNLLRLINVFNDIKNNKYKLYIFGKGPQKEMLEKRILEIGAEGEIKIMDSVSHHNLINIIASSRFVILPSISEISPNLALECISMAKPIILTKNTGLNHEIVKEIITFDPMLEDSIREKIEFLLQDNNLYNYANRLRELNIEKREWSDVAKDHLIIFYKIINE